MKYILRLIIPLFFISSCYNEDKHYSTKEEHNFYDSEITINAYSVKPSEIESKMGKSVIYFFPMINGEAVDVHLRIEKGKNNCCAIHFFQGDPMKVDPDYQRLVNENRIGLNKNDIKSHKTTYKEQIDILRFSTFICEKKIGIKDYAHLIFGFEDLGDLNLEITELCDSIKNVNKNEKKQNIFSLAMEKTILAKDLSNIYKQYDVGFVGYASYDNKSVPYNQYVIHHVIDKKYNASHVYLIEGFIVRLNKNNRNKINK